MPGKKVNIKPLIITLLLLAGLFLFNQGQNYTSTNEFCASCHVHPQASQSWKLGTHYDTGSGFVANCVDCHLPPGGMDYYQAKLTTGARDIYGVLFKDKEEMNWQLKSTREAAAEHVYEASCLHCHQNLFPRTLTAKGADAHLYFDQNRDALRCINCHLQTGHYHEKAELTEEIVSADNRNRLIYSSPAFPDSFKNFTEMIPGSTVHFEMAAIAGGTFIMGSPQSESLREADEGPQHPVEVNSFWMGTIEVSWQEFEVFLKETGVKSSAEAKALAAMDKVQLDAISGPTPPYGNPDQGWGRGLRPAISMTHYAARTYCEWLSQKTAKKYRLPTEAEWEYACRAGSEGAYFFKGAPDDFDTERLANRLFGADTTINRYLVYAANSSGSTHMPFSKKANAFGLFNMPGNVKEFCLDYYQAQAYSQTPATDNQLPSAGDKEFVIRGGSFKSSAGDVRSAARESTRSKAWLITDPQMPKSRWWYSDCNDVGFRVVCEYPINK